MPRFRVHASSENLLDFLKVCKNLNLNRSCIIRRDLRGRREMKKYQPAVYGGVKSEDMPSTMDPLRTQNE